MVSMTVEDTQIDALPTPGHIFAYRAFRNFVWGSPETSPMRPHEEDKENVYEARQYSSPAKRKGLEGGLTLTPKRQKTIAVSPTKSILRNRNEPTPRRALLRDVNVTFKDVKKNISPELVKQSSTSTTVRPVATATSTKPVHYGKVNKTEMHGTEEKRTSWGLDNQNEGSKAAPASTSAFNFDIEAYKESTERELRKLLKYSQKMREKAKKSEQENDSLRKLVEELQRDNARLSQQLQQRHAEDNAQKTLPGKSVREWNSVSDSRHGDKTGRKLDSKPLQPVHKPEVDLISRQKTSQTAQTRLAQSTFDHARTSLGDKPVRKSSTRSAEIHRDRHGMLVAKEQPDTEQLNNMYLPTESLPPPQSPPPVSEQKHALNIPLRPAEKATRPTNTASLPKDSLAIERQMRARERLDAKRQARLASSQIKLIVSTSKTEATKDEGIDWLNL